MNVKEMQDERGELIKAIFNAINDFERNTGLLVTELNLDTFAKGFLDDSWDHFLEVEIVLP
jgi:hypothetical protein